MAWTIPGVIRMALDQRMSAIQRSIKERQAYLDARPERAAKWVGRLNELYDRIDAALADEVAQGLCVVSRIVKSAKADDLGDYEEPGIAIEIEGVAYVASSVRRATATTPDIVDLRGTTGRWNARLSFISDPAGKRQWAIAATEHAAYLDKVDSAWLTPEAFKRAIEPFFPFP